MLQFFPIVIGKDNDGVSRLALVVRDPQRPDSRAGFALSVAAAQSFQRFIDPIFLSALQVDRPLIDVGEPTIDEIRF